MVYFSNFTKWLCDHRRRVGSTAALSGFVLCAPGRLWAQTPPEHCPLPVDRQPCYSGALPSAKTPLGLVPGEDVVPQGQ